jgi:hypothetical protein
MEEKERKAYKAKRISIDWFIVSYRTIIFWGVLIAVVIASAGFFLYRSHIQGSPKGLARREIKAAAAAIDQLRKIEEARAELSQPSELLIRAQTAYKIEDYKRAFDYAKEAREVSRVLLNRYGKEGGEDLAYLTSFEGRVEVKRKGEVAWQEIRVKKPLPLGAGDMVKTAFSSLAQVVFFDGTNYTVQPGSLVVIQRSYHDPVSKSREVSVKLDSGTVDLSTVKGSGAGASSIVSETAKAVVTGESKARMKFSPARKEAEVSLLKGEAQVEHKGEKLSLSPLERVKVLASKGFTPKRKILPPPILLSPVHERQFLLKKGERLKVNFSWQEVPRAGGYLLEVSRTPLFAEPVLEKRTKNNWVTVSGISQGIYYWRVAIIGQNREMSPFSDGLKFRVREAGGGFDTEDKTPPDLSVYEPITFGNIFLVTGKTEPGVMLTVNNQRIDVEEDGNFKDFVTLYKVGRNKLVFVAQDPSGNETVKTKEVYVEVY